VLGLAITIPAFGPPLNALDLAFDQLFAVYSAAAPKGHWREPASTAPAQEQNHRRLHISNVHGIVVLLQNETGFHWKIK
jgi:hypothetical protein